ncbi:hypothetical protein MRX96_053461 [Rhipicephalus microplus]
MYFTIPATPTTAAQRHVVQGEDFRSAPATTTLTRGRNVFRGNERRGNGEGVTALSPCQNGEGGVYREGRVSQRTAIMRWSPVCSYVVQGLTHRVGY